MSAHPLSPEPGEAPEGVRRRRFLGYLLAAPTVMAAASLGEATGRAPSAQAAVNSAPQLAEVYDLNDMLTDAALPTSQLVSVQIHRDGTASFDMPRAEVGQGITTSTAMLIAEELDLPVDKVRVTLADARPELLFNQLTGGSNTTIATYTPFRVAAAIARGQLLRAAAVELDGVVTELTTKAGVITSQLGGSISYADLAEKAATSNSRQVEAQLKPRESFSVIGKPHNRVDAHDIVTGRKKFSMDLAVPDAKPTMICRAPTLNGKPVAVTNEAAVRAMPGVTDVAVISTGIAVRAETFGQCIDAVRALRAEWKPGTAAGKSDEDVHRELQAAEIPLVVPDVDPLAKTVDSEFTFYFRSNSSLEPNCAVADVRPDRAEIWSGLKAPAKAQEMIAAQLGLPPTAVTVHVVEGGGSFGRKLFHDAAAEAAEASQKMGKPVRLMWHRTDDSRVGRTHPMCTSRVRATYLGEQVLTYEQRHTSVSTDFDHGLGEIVTAMAGKLPPGNFSLAQSIFLTTQQTGYHFGVTTQLLDEVDSGFNTGSMRNVYSPDVRCATELIADQIAAGMGKDPYEFRRELLKDERARAVLDKVAEEGSWGRSMPAGTARGIAIHLEYKGAAAALVELDCRPETVHRPIREGVTGPRVSKVVFAVDVGLPVNPRGLEAQIMGGINDGIALALTSSLHLQDGHFLEGSWDDYFYTRQWNTPPEMQIIVMPPTTGRPGGAGEFGVAASYAAIACAYGRATGEMPTSFPINHDTLSFEPKPNVPPVPQSPTNGLDHAR